MQPEDEENEQNGSSASPSPIIVQCTVEKRRPSKQLPGALTPPQKRFQPNDDSTKYFQIAVNNLHDHEVAEDEYDAFANHIAAQLRTLPTPNFVILQEKIQALVTAERLSSLKEVIPNSAASDECNPNLS